MADSWAALAEAAIASGQLDFDPDKMDGCIRYCDDFIQELTLLRKRADLELYRETLGIGEPDIQTAQAIVKKFQEKARGGDGIPQESSAVGYIDSHIDYVTQIRDALQKVRDNYQTTDADSAANLGAVEVQQ
ncbi:hypothetical protein [Rhodococcus sp. HNM0569]|uniref:hypothetical protein n=1 Tax=Rhodococcus sp. HNM0569 TaxID=2716340 RepID=UPI00146D7746|nr:hypothetical protein [Rhodococcus sp. HNM0569]NLU83618.1 hypothetical protein [Rhodococcus sp. HNM0569]